MGDEEEALTEELLLCWRPEPGSPVREGCAKTAAYDLHAYKATVYVENM